MRGASCNGEETGHAAVGQNHGANFGRQTDGLHHWRDDGEEQRDGTLVGDDGSEEGGDEAGDKDHGEPRET